MIRCSKSSPFVSGVLIDISISGCLIRTAEPLTVGPEDVIELRIDLNSLVFRVLGFVRHASKGSHTLGIEFHHMSDQNRSDLEIFIDYHAAA